MARGIFESPLVRIVNGVAVGPIKQPVIAHMTSGALGGVRYVGRRSGKTFEIPVGYRRTGDALVIGVASPDAKNWWRNFLGEGGPITLVDLDGADRTGHAVADRDDNGRVRVT